jgi:hypothetical protein
MDDEFKTKMIGMVLFVLFSWLILSVAVDFGASYDKNADEIGNGSLSLSSFRTVADTIEGNTSAFKTSFEDGSVDDVDDASGIFGTLKKIGNLIVAPFTLLGQILLNIFHIPKTAINILLGILSIGLMLGMWRVLRAGS